MATISYLSLLLLIFLWTITLSPSDIFPKSLVLIFLVLPLLTPLNGVLKSKIYTLAWSPFLIVIYFALGIGNLLASQHPTYLSVLEISLSLIFIFSAGFYVKLTPKS